MFGRVVMVVTMLVLAGSAAGSGIEDFCGAMGPRDNPCPVRQHDGGSYAPLGAPLQTLHGDAPDACLAGAAPGDPFTLRWGRPSNGTLVPADDWSDNYWLDIPEGTTEVWLRAEARAALSPFPGLFLWEWPGADGPVLSAAPAAHLEIRLLDTSCSVLATSTTASPMTTVLHWPNPMAGAYRVSMGYRDVSEPAPGSASSSAASPDPTMQPVTLPANEDQGPRPQGEHPCGPMCMSSEQSARTASCALSLMGGDCQNAGPILSVPSRGLVWFEHDTVPACQTGREDVDALVAQMMRIIVEAYHEQSSILFSSHNEGRFDPRSCLDTASDENWDPITSGLGDVTASTSFVSPRPGGEGDSCEGCTLQAGSPAAFNYRIYPEIHTRPR